MTHTDCNARQPYCRDDLMLVDKLFPLLEICPGLLEY